MNLSGWIEPGQECSSLPLTVTHLLEHLYCPRFSYFEHVLAIPERQERRILVQRGRQVHEERKLINPRYLRKKWGVINREFDIPLFSKRLGVRGIVDELWTLQDGTMAPFDYKFAIAPKEVFRNQHMQSALYALMIQETFSMPVTRGFLCFIRSKYRVVSLSHSTSDYAFVEKSLREILSVICEGWFPNATKWKKRCHDCCYRNICPK